MEESFTAQTLIHLSAGSSFAKIAEIYLKPTYPLKNYSSVSIFLHRFWIYQGVREPKLDTVLLKHLYSFRGGVMLGDIGISQLARA